MDVLTPKKEAKIEVVETPRKTTKKKKKSTSRSKSKSKRAKAPEVKERPIPPMKFIGLDKSP